jgi:hypothetical protein
MWISKTQTQSKWKTHTQSTSRYLQWQRAASHLGATTIHRSQCHTKRSTWSMVARTVIPKFGISRIRGVGARSILNWIWAVRCRSRSCGSPIERGPKTMQPGAERGSRSMSELTIRWIWRAGRSVKGLSIWTPRERGICWNTNVLTAEELPRQGQGDGSGSIELDGWIYARRKSWGERVWHPIPSPISLRFYRVSRLGLENSSEKYSERFFLHTICNRFPKHLSYMVIPTNPQSNLPIIQHLNSQNRRSYSTQMTELE